MKFHIEQHFILHNIQHELVEEIKEEDHVLYRQLNQSKRIVSLLQIQVEDKENKAYKPQ